MANPMTNSLVLPMSITMVSVTIITNMLLRVVIGLVENVSSTIKFILSYRLFGKLCHTFEKVM